MAVNLMPVPLRDLIDEVVMRSPTLRLGELVQERFAAFVGAAMSDRGAAINQAAIDHLFLGGTLRAPDRSTSDEERFFFEFFYVFGEALNGPSILTEVRDRVRYITIRKIMMLPHKRTPASQLSATLWLYFHELNVWSVRVKTLSWIIGGCYDWQSGVVSTRSDSLVAQTDAEVRRKFDQELRIRHDHVHRLSFTDDDLRRIGTLELLLFLKHADDDPILLNHYRSEFSKTRRSWLKRIDVSKARATEVLDTCSDVWRHALFDRHGKWILPAAPWDFALASAKRRKRLLGRR